MLSRRFLISDMMIIAKMFRRYYVYSKRNRHRRRQGKGHGKI